MHNTWLRNFEKAEVGLDGVLYKAGFTSLDDTLEGLGRGHDGNEWVAYGSSTVENGGLKSASGGSISISFPDAVGRFSAIREAFMHRGSIQFDLYVDDVCDNSVSTRELVSSTSDAGGLRSPAYLRYQSPAIVQSNSYNRTVTGYDGVHAFDSPCHTLTGGNVIGVAEDCNVILHRGLKDAEGYLKYGIDWAGNWQRHFINGYLVAEMQMDTYPGEFQFFTFQNGLTQVSMKNILIANRPFQRLNKPDVRLSLIGHSYVARQQLKRKYPYNGVIGGLSNTAFAFGGLEALNTSIARNMNAEVDVYSTGYSAQDLSYQSSRIIDGTPTAFSAGAGNDQDQVKRYRPHFCVIFGSHINDGGETEANLQTLVYNITIDLMNNGIIPVWCVEWDNITQVNADEQGYVVAEVERLQAVNDIGLIDGVEKFGADPDHSLSAYESSLERHPNFKGQDQWGEYIASEVNRLLLNPPQYSRLAGGLGQYQAIAAP